jgi:prevent-host-death family protein
VSQVLGPPLRDHGKMTMISKLHMKTKTIPAGTFKARCLAIMDEVQAKRQAVVITKRGKPVAKLVPVEQEKDDIFGFMKGKGKIEIKGNIISPALTPEEWGDLY